MASRATIDPPISKGHRNLILASTAMTFALITMGGIVCVTGSARGCPDWPGCYGQVVPPLQTDAVIEYLHRFIAGVTGLAIIAAAYLSLRNARAIHWVSRPVTLAVVFVIAVVIFGAFAIITGIPPIVAAIDLGSALIVLALLLTASVAALAPRPTFAFANPFSRMCLATTAGVFLVLASSVLVAETGSISRCLGWPIYSEPLALGDWQSSLGLARRALALISSISVLALMILAWRRENAQPVVKNMATAVVVLFIVETLVGALIASGGPAILLRAVYVATTAAFWASLVVLTVVAGLATGRIPRRVGIRPTTGRA